MTEVLAVIVAALAVIAASTVVGQRLGIAPTLLLVATAPCIPAHTTTVPSRRPSGWRRE